MDRLEQGLGRDAFDPSLLLPAQVELHVTVDSMDPFMIPGISVSADQRKQFVKSIARILLDQGRQFVDHLAVILGPALIVEHRAADPEESTCLPNAQAEYLPGIFGQNLAFSRLTTFFRSLP